MLKVEKKVKRAHLLVDQTCYIGMWDDETAACRITTHHKGVEDQMGDDERAWAQRWGIILCDVKG